MIEQPALTKYRLAKEWHIGSAYRPYRCVEGDLASKTETMVGIGSILISRSRLSFASDAMVEVALEGKQVSLLVREG